jgi:hypothetical protein
MTLLLSSQEKILKEKIKQKSSHNLSMNKSRRSQSEAKIEIVPEAAQIIKATHTPSSFAKPLFSPHQETILSLAE